MKMRIAMAAALALAACGAKTPGPDAAVKAIYAPYVSGPANAIPAFDSRDIFTPALKAEIARGETYGNLIDQPVIDYDPILGGQDGEVKNLVVSPAEITGDSANVKVKFSNQGVAKEQTFAMQRIDGQWRVDDIFEGETGLRSIVAEGLKPAGDPAAMEAPVRTLYARYAGGDRATPPLETWAPLTDDLHRRLAAATARTKTGGAPLLDFDPVVDGKQRDIGSVNYETVAGAVIARFDAARDPKIIVYDVTEQGGGWKIANIRSPGHWDVEQKLNEAGIQ